MRLFLAILAMLAAVTAPAKADDSWPQRQVTIIVPFAAGGTADLFGRMLAAHLQAKYGKPFVVENRVGAAGNIGTTAAARAAPDGTTILLGTTGGFAINPSLYSKLAHDTVRDFQPVSLIARVPNLLVVSNSLPVKTMPELIAYLKANPDKLSYGSSGIGSSQHLGTELFITKTGTKMTHMPVSRLERDHERAARRPRPARARQHHAGAAAGESRHGAAARHEHAGALAERAGHPHHRGNAAGLRGLGVARHFPSGRRAALDRRQAQRRHAGSSSASADVKAKFFEIGAVPAPTTPEEFAAFVAEERTKWAEVVKASGAKVD